MSRYIRLSNTTRERYTSLPKGHKLEGLVLVGERNISLRRKGVEAPVYSYFYGYYPNVEFFATWHSIHVVEKGPGGCLFDPTEALDCERAVIQLICGRRANN